MKKHSFFFLETYEVFIEKYINRQCVSFLSLYVSKIYPTTAQYKISYVNFLYKHYLIYMFKKIVDVCVTILELSKNA